jgi:hypothetical protein
VGLSRWYEPGGRRSRRCPLGRGFVETLANKLWGRTRAACFASRALPWRRAASTESTVQIRAGRGLLPRALSASGSAPCIRVVPCESGAWAMPRTATSSARQNAPILRITAPRSRTAATPRPLISAARAARTAKAEMSAFSRRVRRAIRRLSSSMKSILERGVCLPSSATGMQ